MALETTWSIGFFLERKWFCVLDGEGPMPAVPRVGESVTGSWMPRDAVPEGMLPRAIVNDVLWDVEEVGPDGCQFVTVILSLRWAEPVAPMPGRKNGVAPDS